MFVYRLCCGVMLAHTSAREIGLSSTPQAGAFAGVDQATTPAQPERVIADGATDDGVRWTLTARGDDENYVTMLRTEDSAGVIDNGGMGGPKLWGSDLLKVIPAATPIEGHEGFSCAANPRSSISAWSTRTAQKLRWSPTQKSTVCASRSFWSLPRRDFER